MTNLSALSRWLVSTDPEQATYSTLEEPVTYDEVEYDIDTPEYRLAKYKNELSEHASVDALVFYYVFTETFLCIDQREKNAFPTLFDALKLWMVLFYDADSSLGTDNKGNLAFDFFLEDIDYTEAGDPVFNGQNSVLWSNLRKTFYDKILAEYTRLRTELRTDGSGQPLLSYDVVDAMFENHQDKWPEAVFNEDAYKKCLEPLIKAGDGLYLPMLQGKKEQHRKWWLYNRFRYLDSKYVTGTSMTNRITIRAHAKNNVFLTSFVNMYGHVYYNAEMVEHRMVPGVEYEFEWAATGAEDAVIGINDADMLTSLGDLSSLMVELIDVSKATHLTHLKVGDASEGYVNNNLVSVTHGNNTLLRTVDYRNCQSLAMAVDMSGCTNIEEVYFDGTSITGLSLPNGGILKVLHLPGTVTNLTIRNQKKITDFTMPSYANITTLRLENVSEVIDMKTILNAIAANSRVRLIGFNWEAESVDEIRTFFDKLDTMRGLDENGNNLDKAVAGGTIHIDAITGAELAELQSRYATVNITYDHITSYIYYYNFDGSELVHTEAVYDGGDGVYAGTVSRPSTAQYNYTFAGWSKEKDSLTADTDALKNVTADRNVYAAYTATVRTYSVYFYNDTTLLQTVENVPYGGSATYIGDEPVNNTTGNPDDFEFKGWSPSPTNIKGDTYCYAIFLDKREIGDSWETIIANVDNGTAVDKYSVGMFKTLDFGEIKLPYAFSQSSAVVYNNEIHILGSSSSSYRKYHYKWNGTEWVSVSTLPYYFYRGSAVVYNDEIHIMGSSYTSAQTYHYKWNGSSWSSVSTLPYSFYDGSAVVYNGEIHIMGTYVSEYRNSHYKWNGTEWSEVSTLPYENYYDAGPAVVFNNEIHILGASDSTVTSNEQCHYKWNGSEWSEVSTTPYAVDSSSVVVYNGAIHVIGGIAPSTYKHCKWDGNSWSVLQDATIGAVSSPAVVFNESIHVLGSNVNEFATSHHIYSDDTSWIKNGVTESIPMQIAGINHDAYPEGVGKWENISEMDGMFTKSTAVNYKGELHILGSSVYSSYRNKHWKWDGTTLTSVGELPVNFSGQHAIVYNDEIHIFSGTIHYKWDGTTWTEVSVLPIDAGYRGISDFVIVDDELHFLKYNNTVGHYKYNSNDTTWTEESTTSGVLAYSGTSAVVYNGEIHLLGSGNSNTHRKYDASTSSWVTVSTLPYTFNYGRAVVFDDKIHIMGSKDSGATTMHYAWDGESWSENTKLYNYVYGSASNAIVYDNKITLLGAGGSSDKAIQLHTVGVKATLTFIAKNVLSETRNFDSDLNGNSWHDSDLRNYLNDVSFINTLPSALQLGIKNVNKITANSTNEELINASEKIWLLSHTEVGFSVSGLLDGQGVQYSIFTDNESRKRTTVNNETAAYWLRSPHLHLRGCVVDARGSGIVDNQIYNGNKNSVLIGFCL